MTLSTMEFNVNTENAFLKKCVSYELAKLGNKQNKVSIKITCIRKDEKTNKPKKYSNYFTFYRITKYTYKWWDNNNTILRLGNIEQSVKTNISGIDKINDFLLKKYIFLQSLVVAFPDFHEKSSEYSIYNKIKRKYVDGKFCKKNVIKKDLLKRNIKFNVCIYKIKEEYGIKYYLSLIDSNGFRIIKDRVSKGILRALANDNPNKYLKRAIKKLRVRIGKKRDLTVYDMYEKIRRLTKNILEDYKNRDLIIKDINNKYVAFINSLKDFNISNDERKKKFKELKRTYISIIDDNSEHTSTINGLNLFNNKDLTLIKKVIDCCSKPIKLYKGEPLHLVKAIHDADVTKNNKQAFKILKTDLIYEMMFNLKSYVDTNYTKKNINKCAR